MLALSRHRALELLHRDPLSPACLQNVLCCPVDFFGCCVPPYRKPDCSQGKLRGDLDGLEGLRECGPLPSLAGGASRCSHLVLKLEQEERCVGALDAEAEGVGDPLVLIHGAVEPDPVLGEAGDEPAAEAVPHLLHVPPEARALAVQQLRGLPKAAQQHHALRAGASAPLLPAPKEHLRELGAAPHVEGGGALGPADLVGDKRGEVHAEVVHVKGDLPEALRRVGVEADAGLARPPADLADGL
mmetsp:Transcript_38053/g.90411  ORF Transcript_38053/g.90411 Transcript_38053/m.90411 type:complete len:243 (-) Transcript_38053:850-1578(-)